MTLDVFAPMLGAGVAFALTFTVVFTAGVLWIALSES
jgi:hypothetical protein